MEQIERQAAAVLKLLPYQVAALSCQARFTWNCWARQTGKSFTFGLRRLLHGISRRRNQIILSAGQRQSREVMTKLRQHCVTLRIWHEFNERPFYANTSIRELEITLPAGVRIIALPANPLTARGYTGDVFLDEFAMHTADAAIWTSLFPSLLRGNGELDIASTPRGRKNMFYRLRNNNKFEHHTVTLEQAVSQGLAVDIPTLRAAVTDDLAWRQEFCCEFADESTAFMTYELIRSCQDPRLTTPIDAAALTRKSAELYLGVDIGRFHDLTVFWLWERQGDTFITRGIQTLESAPFALQESELVRLLNSPALRRCCIDGGGLGLQLAERMTERFGDHRIETVTFTAPLKSELAGQLRVSAERGLLRIPADQTIANDWHSIARLVTHSGHIPFDADRSNAGHADRFWAAALGLHAADGQSTDTGMLTSGPLTFARNGIW